MPYMILEMMIRLTLSAFVCAAVAFAQLPSLFPPDMEHSAKVLQMTGQVSVLKDNNPWALHIGDWVQARQIIVTGDDGFAVLQVNDGSTFDVYPNSRVIFRNNAGSWTDLLDLFLGRVKVHIQKFGGQPNPNRVTTPTAVISVRGTVFDVQIEDDDATTLVVVDEGQVAVRHALIPASEQKLLNAGEFLRVFRDQAIATKSFDRGGALKRALQAASDAYYTIMMRIPRGGSTTPGSGTPPPVGGGGGGGGLPGDTESQTPAPAPPPPPPPPPPQ